MIAGIATLLLLAMYAWMSKYGVEYLTTLLIAIPLTPAYRLLFKSTWKDSFVTASTVGIGITIGSYLFWA